MMMAKSSRIFASQYGSEVAAYLPESDLSAGRELCSLCGFVQSGVARWLGALHKGRSGCLALSGRMAAPAAAMNRRSEWIVGIWVADTVFADSLRENAHAEWPTTSKVCWPLAHVMIARIV